MPLNLCVYKTRNISSMFHTIYGGVNTIQTRKKMMRKSKSRTGTKCIEPNDAYFLYWPTRKCVQCNVIYPVACACIAKTIWCVRRRHCSLVATRLSLMTLSTPVKLCDGRTSERAGRENEWAKHLWGILRISRKYCVGMVCFSHVHADTRRCWRFAANEFAAKTWKFVMWLASNSEWLLVYAIFNHHEYVRRRSSSC